MKANQILRITSDFKMDVIMARLEQCRRYACVTRQVDNHWFPSTGINNSLLLCLSSFFLIPSVVRCCEF